MLPHILKARYGSQNRYTPGQVKTAAEIIRLKLKIMPYAYALACSVEDFADVLPHLDAKDYQTNRNELARLFYFDEPDMTCRKLTSTFANPVGEQDSVGLWTGAGSDSGADADGGD